MIFSSYDVDSSIRNWKNLIKIDSRRSSKKCYLCLYLFARVTFLCDSFLKRLYRSLLIWMIKREKGRGSTRRILKFNCTQLKRLWGRITTSCVETLERYRYERERERAASFVTISFFPLPVSSLDISLSRNLVSLSKGFLSSRLVNVPR